MRRARWRTLAWPCIGALMAALFVAVDVHERRWAWGALWATFCALDVHEIVRRREGGEP